MWPATLYTCVVFIAVAVVTAAASLLLPARWGWWSFPVVLLMLAGGLSAFLFGLVPLFAPAGGAVIHFNVVDLLAAPMAFGVTLVFRRRLRNNP